MCMYKHVYIDTSTCKENIINNCDIKQVFLICSHLNPFIWVRFTTSIKFLHVDFLFKKKFQEKLSIGAIIAVFFQYSRATPSSRQETETLHLTHTNFLGQNTNSFVLLRRILSFWPNSKIISDLNKIAQYNMKIDQQDILKLFCICKKTNKQKWVLVTTV